MEVPTWVTALPTVNASLNGLATVLLVAGYVSIRFNKRGAHKKIMLSAVAVSVVFLICYLAYHFALKHYTGSGSKPFTGVGTVRLVYFTILISHIVLAAAVPILASMNIYWGLKEDWSRHARLARFTWPIWLYVSVTGVIIYLMVYHWPQVS